MINYGEMAYNQIKDMQRDKLKETHGFNCIHKNFDLSQTKSNFSINLKTNKEKIFIILKTSLNCDLKTYVNSNLEYANYSSNSFNFNLFLENNSLIEFRFINITENITAELIIIGNFGFESIKKLHLIPTNNNLKIINQNENNFYVYEGDSTENTLAKYKLGIKESIDGKLVDCIFDFPNLYMLINKNNKSFIKFNNSEIEIVGGVSETACLFLSEVYNSKFILLDLLNGEVVIKFINEDGSLNPTIINKTIKINNCLKSIKKVFNYINNDIFFIATDNNNNNYIVLCKFDNNVVDVSFSYYFNLGKGKDNSVIKTGADNFVSMLKIDNKIKINKLILNFNTQLMTVESTNNFNNATDACYINNNNYVLNFNETLILSE